MLSEIHGKMQTDQFHPEKLLAAGPSAKVYRGVESATGRKVLIKALLPDDETPHALDRERLQLLAPALMQMRHPQIAGLITLMPTEEEFALVYEFMPGMNVREFAAARQVSAADLRALAMQFMHALLVGEHLRQAHGDPKPSNVIIADHPGGGLFLQVQDWGLSLARTVHPAETMWFRAPELHYSGVPTAQSDLFTAAATLFCLATNTAPTQGAAVEELVHQWQAFNAAHFLQHLRPDLDQPLRDWLAWLMQTNPHQRPQCVAQALDMLMLSMHTGFTYMPQQAPQMMPGTQTTPLVSFGHPNAPKPKPIVSKAQVAAASGKTNSVKTAKPDSPTKRSAKRVLVAVALNLVALVLAGFFIWPAMGGADSETVAAPSSAPAPGAPPPAMLKGRYIRIELKGKVALNLAEVQIFSGDKNIAVQGTAAQSSTAPGGNAALAIDGNTDGDMPKSASVILTDAKKSDPWWQVDLGEEMPLNSIVLWNRTDGDAGAGMNKLTVKVLSAHQRVIWEKKELPKPEPELRLLVGE